MTHEIEPAATLNIADLFESVADAVGERTAIVFGDRRLTYRQLDERATRLAHALLSRGVGRGANVGLYLYNGPEYIEAMLAAFKVRAVPVNANYRYVSHELEHLVRDAELVALVFHRELEPVVADVSSIDRLALRVRVDEHGGTARRVDADEYEQLIAGSSPQRDFGERSPDDHYILYTGGTTGLPKGVVWRHEDIFHAALSAGLAAPVTVDTVVRRARDGGGVSMPVCPLMHASGQWGSLGTLLAGGTVVLPVDRHLRPDRVLSLIDQEKVEAVTVVGDAAGRPLMDELEAHRDRYDLGSLRIVGSGGSILSPALKRRMLELLPGAVVVDAFGASESGAQGISIATSDDPVSDARFMAGDGTTVVGDDRRPVAPGEAGWIARSGHVPLGYYGDAARSRTTFFEHDGRRWSLPGDRARLEHDGTITLIGRGSLCINTGGEKVFPEEVELALRSHPGVVDALVVGIPDERWGEAVAAVVAPADDADVTLEGLRTHCGGRLAGYKLPKRIAVVSHIERTPAGKGDYDWARSQLAHASEPEVVR